VVVGDDRQRKSGRKEARQKAANRTSDITFTEFGKMLHIVHALAIS
jgi:hypothetical protein